MVSHVEKLGGKMIGRCDSAVVEPPWTVGLARLSDRPPHAIGRKWRGHGERLPALPCALPGSTAGDPVRAWALALRRRCAVCGCEMRGPFYTHYFSHKIKPVSECPAGVFATDIPGPAHRSCALYSAIVCPFFKYRTSRQRQPNMPNVPRGDAAVLGFARFGTNYTAEPNQRGFHHSFGLTALVERIPFEASSELLPLYHEAVAADAEMIDISTRLYWGNSPDDAARLRECKQADDAAILACASRVLEPSAVAAVKLSLQRADQWRG